MNPQFTLPNRLMLPVFLLLSIGYFYNHLTPEYYIDDAYIYLRVIQNILSGQGWVYNAGEVLNVCSSVSYTLVLLAVSWIISLINQTPMALDVQLAPGIVQILSVWVTAVVTWMALAKQPLTNRLAFTLCLALQPLLLKAAGMESGFVVASLCVASYFFCAKKWLACGIALAVAGLARTECYALVAFVGFFVLIDERRLPAPLLLGFFVPSALWYGFSQWYFGEWFPHTTYAKIAQAQMIREMTPQVGSRMVSVFAKQPTYPLLTLALAVPGLIKLVADWRAGERFIIVLFLVGLTQFLAYSVMHAIPYFWYFVPINMAANIAVLAGLLFIVGLLKPYLLKIALIEKLLLARTGTILSSMVLAGCLIFIIDVYGVRPYKAAKPYHLASVYRSIGQWINEHSARTETVAVLEVGYIGYYAQRPMIDKNGLTQRAALAMMKTEKRGWWYKLQPDWIVKHQSSILDNFYSHEVTRDFKANYRLEHKVGKQQIWHRISE